MRKERNNERTDAVRSGPEGEREREGVGKKNNRLLRAAAEARCSAWDGGSLIEQTNGNREIKGKAWVGVVGRDWPAAGQRPRCYV